MENKLLELFEKQDTVSMNDDIFPLVEEEFAGQVMGNEVYEPVHRSVVVGCVCSGNQFHCITCFWGW